MTENTQTPHSLATQAEKIRADLMEALLKAAKAAQTAPTAAPATNPAAPAETPVAKAP